MDRSVVYYTTFVVAVAIVAGVVCAFRAPARFEQFVRRITLWYNLLVIAVMTCLVGGTVFFSAGMVLAPAHEKFFWVYMTGACLFGVFALYHHATRHRRSDFPGLLRETAQLWRERFGTSRATWKDVGRE